MTDFPKMQWPRWEYALVSLLLSLMAALSIASSRQQSATYDEVVHIPSGLSYLQKQDARLNLEHPPLLKIIAAFPLLFSDVRANYGDRSWCGAGGLDCQWSFGQHFFSDWNQKQGAAHIVFLARMPMILLMLCFGLAVYVMARTLAGTAGALLSLAVFTTSPFYLSYGPLVITDMGMALFCLLTAWLAANLRLKTIFASVIKLALAAAAALLSKFSAVLIVPSIALFWIWMWLSAPKDRQETSSTGEQPPNFRKASAYLLMAGVLSLAVTWGFYWLTTFHSSTREILNARNAYVAAFRPPERILASTTYFLAKHPGWEHPLQPLWLYLGGIGYLNAGLTRPVYLLGKLHGHGVWYYFPVIAFFKLAPGEVLLLLFLATLTAVQFWQEHRRHEEGRAGQPSVLPQLSYANRVRVRALISFLLVFTAAAMRSRLNIGVRHISVPLSILAVLLALLVPQVRAIAAAGKRTLAFSAIMVLVFSCFVTALAAFPHYISYFNDFRFAAPKQEITTDSNLDWGQTLPAVASFAAQHQIANIYVDGRMTPLLPNTYVPQAKPWKCDNPAPEAPQWAVVSANFLLKQEPTCIGLMKYQHWNLPGDAMVVFRITDQSYAEARRQYLKTHPTVSVAPPIR